MVMQGYTFYFRGKDYFIVTTKTRKTRKLAQQVLEQMDLLVTDNHIDIILRIMEKAKCEIRGENRKYYEISGENFGGRGSFLDDGNTIIIYLVA